MTMSTHDETSHLPLKYLQDDEITKECKELLLSLPKERGWISSYLYQYQGFWHMPLSLQGTIAFQKHFQAQDSDILLVTTPKSGTTWLKAMAFAVMKRKDYLFTQDHPLYMNNPHDLVPFIDQKFNVDNQSPDLSSYESPRLYATHLPFVSMPKSVHESPCKIVYLSRNPKDTFVSMWHFVNNIRLTENMESIALEDMFDMFCRGVSLRGPFWDHVLGYWKQSLKNPHKFFFLKFEDLKENPTFCLRKLAMFLDCPFSSEEEELGIIDEILNICSFDYLSNLEVNRSGKLQSGIGKKTFFRLGEVGDWKNFLTTKMADQLNRLCEEKFGPFGLKL